jgi:hypothetical protein
MTLKAKAKLASEGLFPESFAFPVPFPAPVAT